MLTDSTQRIPRQANQLRLVERVTLEELKAQKHEIEGSKATDVTGGMLGKMRELVPAIEHEYSGVACERHKALEGLQGAQGRRSDGDNYRKRVKLLDDVIGERKADHIEVCLKEDVQSKKVSTGFEEIHLVHRAIPEIEREKVDLSTTVFGYKFSAPVFVGAMTGGTAKATKINAAHSRSRRGTGSGHGCWKPKNSN